MKSGRLKSRGFTIVETLIFLAVSAVILISAMTLISGAQDKTQFQQAANDIQQELNDTINNVSTGSYANINNFSKTRQCQASPFPQTSSSVVAFGAVGTGTGQGTSDQCISLGQVIQFAVDGKPESYNVYNIVGLREKSDGTQVTSPADAAPVLIAPGDTTHTGFPTTTQTKTLQNGLAFRWLHYTGHGGKLLTTFGLFSSLDSATPGSISAGSLQADTLPIGNIWGLLGPISAGTAVDAFDRISPFPAYYNTNKNPDSGIVLCFDSGGTNQHVTLTVGGASGQTVVAKQILDGKC